MSLIKRRELSNVDHEDDLGGRSDMEGRHRHLI